jgi:hypothetical protein
LSVAEMPPFHQRRGECDRAGDGDDGCSRNPARTAAPCSTTPSGAKPERSMAMKVEMVTRPAWSQVALPERSVASRRGVSTTTARPRGPGVTASASRRDTSERMVILGAEWTPWRMECPHSMIS